MAEFHGALEVLEGGLVAGRVLAAGKDKGEKTDVLGMIRALLDRGKGGLKAAK